MDIPFNMAVCSSYSFSKFSQRQKHLVQNINEYSSTVKGLISPNETDA